MDNDRTRVIVQDEIMLGAPAQVYWFANTRANIDLMDDGRAALLNQNGHRMWVEIIEPAYVTFEITDASPIAGMPNPAQNQNSGVRRLKIDMPNQGSTTISVVFQPLEPGQTRPEELPTVMPMANWGMSIPDGELEMLALNNLTVNGTQIGGFASRRRSYHYRLPYGTTEVPVITAESDYEMTIVQAQGLPGRATITLQSPTDPTRNATINVDFSVLTGAGEPDWVEIPVQTWEVSTIAESWNGPEAMFEQSLESRFAMEGPQWVMFDFGRAFRLYSVHMAWFRGYPRTYFFEIQVSNDGTSWVSVFDGASSGTTDDIEPHNLMPIETRFVRILVNGNQENQWSNLSRILFYTFE